MPAMAGKTFNEWEKRGKTKILNSSKVKHNYPSDVKKISEKILVDESNSPTVQL